MTQHHLPPFVAIDGVRNFRDFGGYAARNGQQVKLGHLFRSANYTSISDVGIGAFGEKGVRLVVDLRRGAERLSSPSRPLGSDVETLFSSLGDGDGVTLAPHLQFIKSGDLSVESCHNHMLSSYRRIPWEPQHGALFRQTFERLAKGEGPIVIHCAAGKDRTGILCGLILHVLGVSSENIMHDYLLTNAVPLDTPWLIEYANRLSTMFSKEIDPFTLVPMHGVHSDYLEQAWNEMSLRNGGLDGYLASIGVTDSMQLAVQKHANIGNT
jgi:protein-tyrosine phosphatase